MDELFAEVGGGFEMLPILGMDDPCHYRNKVVSPYAPGKKLSAQAKGGCNGERAGKGAAAEKGARGKDGRSGERAGKGARREILTGMYAAGTHRLVPTDTCLLENRTAKAVTLAVRDIMKRYGIEPYNEDTGAGFMRHAVVRVGHSSGEVLVTLVTNSREFPASKSFCRELVRRCPAVTTVVQNVNLRQTNVILGDEERTLYGPGFILDTLCGLSFRISSKSFYQVNAVQTEVLYKTAIRMAHLTGEETVIDAYCGTGTIGLVAACGVDGGLGAARVIGVDSVGQAIHDARQNARHNGVDNAEFVAEDAGAFMRQLADDEAFDAESTVLFMDPPRAGSSEEFLLAAAKLAPGRIVYVSCNAETQVRDVRFLLERGYRRDKVQPVDMFPHTEHVESVALLTRSRD
ncbi:MAG: 23S rRNA (uracil(1939)-C(5))-methyltransferase RlmD [Eggerthellaceae bacterium]|nr:23S rRNA (uracil(1939)-C(5))-methyltransferase RlmD [Eggerthellaceae bacterium]